MRKTSIQWTDATWNPVRGCTRVSPGCVNCYAETMSARNLPGLRSPTTEEAFAIRTPSGPRWTGKVELIESKLEEPLHWKKPRRVFVNSMSDLFHEELPDEAIDRVFAVMALCPHITFQVLTKRPERMLKWMTAIVDGAVSGGRVKDILYRWPRFNPRVRLPKGTDIDAAQLVQCPLPNVHLGVSVEDPKRADERIPLLLQTPAAVRFVSYEPALEAVNFGQWFDPLRGIDGFYRNQVSRGMLNSDQVDSIKNPTLDWIIVGGESGPGARPFDVQWARNTIAQCKAAGVACFVKQLGKMPQGPEQSVPEWVTKLDSHGGNWEVWPQDLRVREFPEKR